jgi:hypothetical protein
VHLTVEEKRRKKIGDVIYFLFEIWPREGNVTWPDTHDPLNTQQLRVVYILRFPLEKKKRMSSILVGRVYQVGDL